MKGFENGQGKSALFSYPEGITYNQGVIYVSDSNNNVIRTVSLNGLVDVFGGTGQSGNINGYRFAFIILTLD